MAHLAPRPLLSPPAAFDRDCRRGALALAPRPVPRCGTVHALARVAALALLLATLGAPRLAAADLANIDLSGKNYTKFMMQNDDSQGCLSLSNPFWVDNIGGRNGACSEFELNIKARIGTRVTAGARLQSRWGALWQDWWENGDLRLGVQDTSGESQGMNHAAYLKLRSTWVRFAPSDSYVRWVTIGSTDYSMWNEWTIGKARYIDRDNGAGVFVEGELLKNRMLSYTTGAMAVPKLWVGPSWNSGLKDSEALAALWGTDWAYALKLESAPHGDVRLRAIGTLVQDWEADRYDPDRTGITSSARGANHAVSLVTRFRGVNATLDGVYTPSRLDWVSATGLVAISNNSVNPDYATNAVKNAQGFSPVLFRRDANGNAIASQGYAGKLLVELFDPLRAGLSAKLEYFNIGSEYNAIMGARREADVLLTDGVIGGGFLRGGQLPTLNIANEFMDFDEPWFESIIGWHGGTALLEYVRGGLTLGLEGTAVTYNTNAQGRDVKNQYPDFLYTHGFTDPAAFTADADYANVHDRGRDPRSVYAEYQDRFTTIAAVRLQYLIPRARGLTLNLKGKFVSDRDRRKLDNPNDDYDGTMLMGFGLLSWQATNELKLSLGHEFSRWLERRRTGTQEAGFYNDYTTRNTSRLGVNYAFGGVVIGYMLEYFHKDLNRGRPGSFDMTWNVWRSKGTVEVAF